MRMPRVPEVTDATEAVIVRELMDAAEPVPSDRVLLHADQLEQGEMYSLADWSVCLINKDTLCFMSVEQHFEVGHLTFKIDQEQLSQGVLGTENVFLTEASAIEHVRTFLAPGDVDGDDHSEGEGSETLDPEYWDDLFVEQSERVTEWLVSYPTIKGYLLPLLKPSHDTLVIGCGNSELSVGLHTDLLQEVTSMDISDVVIEQMRVKYKDSPTMKWDAEDIMAMSYQDDAFDVVIDKSLLDCVFHCDEHEEEVEGMLEELHRVLRKDSGLAVFITIQPESKVLPFMEACKRGAWECQVETIRVETDCLGSVPCNARSSIGEAQLDPEVKRWKAFQLYVCHPLSSPKDAKKGKRQRNK